MPDGRRLAVSHEEDGMTRVILIRNPGASADIEFSSDNRPQTEMLSTEQIIFQLEETSANFLGPVNNDALFERYWSLREQ